MQQQWDEQAIVLTDFAENDSFLCQDTVPKVSIGIATSQASLNPGVVNYRDNCDTLSGKSYCLISDEREHNVIVVHKFITLSPVNFFKEIQFKI